MAHVHVVDLIRLALKASVLHGLRRAGDAREDADLRPTFELGVLLEHDLRAQLDRLLTAALSPFSREVGDVVRPVEPYEIDPGVIQPLRVLSDHLAVE